MRCRGLLLAAFLFMNKTHGQTSLAQSVNLDTLPEVVVSASRSPEPSFSVPYSIDRLRKPMQDLRHPRTLPESMAFLPGVFVQKTNHGGGSPFLRGLTGNQTLLMLDGIRVNNSVFRFGPNQYPNLIDAYTVERMEVLKGTGSVQYGSDALGGVMHAIGQEIRLGGEGYWEARAASRIISQDMEYTLRAEAAYTGKKAGIRGGYTWRQFGDLYGGDTTGIQSPSGYRERDWNLKATMALGSKMRVTASAQQVGQSDVPLYHRVRLENFDYYLFDPQKLLVSYIRLESFSDSGLLRRWRIMPILKKSTEGRRYHRLGSTRYLDERDEVLSYGVVAETEWQIRPWWKTGTGVELYYDDVSSRRSTTSGGATTAERGLYPDGASQLNTSAYSLHHFTWKSWRMDAGLRYNFVQNRIPGKYLDLPGQTANDAILAADALVGQWSLLYSRRGKHAWFTNISTGFRAPGIDDLGTLGLVDFRYELPAYDLKPEKNIHTEAGYRFRSDRLQVQGSLFYMHITDLISRVRSQSDSIQGYPVYIKTNDQEAFIRGTEWAVQASPLTHLQVSVSVSYQYGQNLTRQEPVRRIPPMNGWAMVQYRRDRWYAAADMQWAARQDRLAQGDKDDNRIPAGGTPGWQVYNLHAGFSSRVLQVQLTMSNLFNEDYRTHGSGINGMGRALTLSLALNLSQRDTP